MENADLDVIINNRGLNIEPWGTPHNTIHLQIYHTTTFNNIFSYQLITHNI